MLTSNSSRADPGSLYLRFNLCRRGVVVVVVEKCDFKVCGSVQTNPGLRVYTCVVSQTNVEYPSHRCAASRSLFSQRKKTKQETIGGGKNEFVSAQQNYTSRSEESRSYKPWWWRRSWRSTVHSWLLLLLLHLRLHCCPMNTNAAGQNTMCFFFDPRIFLCHIDNVSG